jgi:predicted RecB family nuclease
MEITNQLFEAYLECPTKCWLLSHCEASLGNIYADWINAQSEAYRRDGVRRLLDDSCHNDIGINLITLVNCKEAKWALAVDVLAQTNNLKSQLHAVKKVLSKDRDEDHYVPILFVLTNKLSQKDRQRIAFDALVISENLEREIFFGQIIHGENFTTLKVDISTLVDKLKRQIADIAALLSNHAPPDLLLKRYCAECEYQINCRQRALQQDDLSLLASMTANERNQNRNKGIFTVHQLSYTFRPRRIPKRAKNQFTRHYTALQALAIREKTVFYTRNSQLP